MSGLGTLETAYISVCMVVTAHHGCQLSWLAVVPLVITNFHFLLNHPHQPLVSYYTLNFHKISFLTCYL